MIETIIQNMDDSLASYLVARASANGRSVREEIHEILAAALFRPLGSEACLSRAIRARISNLGYLTLELPARDAMRPLAEFE